MRVRLTSHHNLGQATIEALLMIVLGFLLVLGIHHIGQLRSSTLDLLGESHFLSFIPPSVNDAQAPSVASAIFNRATVSIASSIEDPLQHRYAKLRLGASIYGSTLRELENQLGFDSATLLQASAQSTPRQNSMLPMLGLNQQAPLVRHSVLLTGYGQADSAQDAQTKIAGSATLWQKSFSYSKVLVNHSAATLQSIDQAWGRAALTSSWLLPWANESLVRDPLGHASALQRAIAIEQTLGGVSK